MTERALVSAPAGAHGGDGDAESHEERTGNPAIRLLDALRAGDDRALLASLSPSTSIVAENLPWACRGPDEVETALREAREHFPGLSFESHARHVGFGLVIEEARVRDGLHVVAADDADPVEGSAEPVEDLESLGSAPASDEGPGTALEPYDDEVAARAWDPDPTHPMWDNAGHASRMTALALWHEHLPAVTGPQPLDLPVRVTVRHDDLQVHEVTLSFPAALWKRALGQAVDPRDVSLSEVQAAFIAPTGAGFTTHEIAAPALDGLATAEVADVRPEAVVPAARPRRRRWVPVLLLALAVLLGAGWWIVQSGQQPSAGGTTVPPAADPGSGTVHTAVVDDTTASSEPPTVSRVHTASAPHRKPTVTLKSDLAFGFDSATLSPEAKLAVAGVARQIRQAGLSGTIYVDGYTDDLGSAAHGRVLSQRRADAVSAYLQAQLLGAPVTIVSAGHGEQAPVASNATSAGRQQNRRVTITLPQP